MADLRKLLNVVMHNGPILSQMMDFMPNDGVTEAILLQPVVQTWLQEETLKDLNIHIRGKACGQEVNLSMTFSLTTESHTGG